MNSNLFSNLVDANAGLFKTIINAFRVRFKLKRWRTLSKFQQINYSSNPTTTFLINNTSGDLVKRSNAGVVRTAESSDDFDTFEDTTASSSTTTYQSAV